MVLKFPQLNKINTKKIKMSNENPWDNKSTPSLDKLVSDFKNFLKIKKQKGKKTNDPSFSGGMKFKSIMLIVGAVFLIFALFNSFYQIDAGEKGVVLRLGKYSKTTDSGLNFLIPFVEDVIIVNIESIRKEEFGFRSNNTFQSNFSDVSRATKTRINESLMLTGDRNVININWVVQYKISNPQHFVFNIKDSRAMVRDLSQMVVRRLVGNRDFDYVLNQREELALETKLEMQEKLDFYKSGLDLVTVQLQDVTPPTTVRPSFNEVNEADQDKTRLVNEAQRTYNEKIPKAKGEAKRLVEEAEGYSIERINEALGNTARYNSVFKEYISFKEVTRTRLYIETMKDILPQVEEVIIIDSNNQIFPLYNLNKK